MVKIGVKPVCKNDAFDILYFVSLRTHCKPGLFRHLFDVTSDGYKYQQSLITRSLCLNCVVMID